MEKDIKIVKEDDKLLTKAYKTAYNHKEELLIFGAGVLCGALAVYRRIEKGIHNFLGGVSDFLSE